MPHTTEPEQLVERYRSLIAQLEIATHDAHKERDTAGREAATGPLEGMAGRGQPARDGLPRAVNEGGNMARKRGRRSARQDLDHLQAELSGPKQPTGWRRRFPRVMPKHAGLHQPAGRSSCRRAKVWDEHPRL